MLLELADAAAELGVVARVDGDPRSACGLKRSSLLSLPAQCGVPHVAELLHLCAT